MNTVMTGTSGAKFDVVSEFPAGRLGYREIESGKFRVRVEPSNGNKLAFPDGWKTPKDGFNRYSTVVSDKPALLAAIATGTGILVAASMSEFNGKSVAAPAAKPDPCGKPKKYNPCTGVYE